MCVAVGTVFLTHSFWGREPGKGGRNALGCLVVKREGCKVGNRVATVKGIGTSTVEGGSLRRDVPRRIPEGI